MPKITPLKQLNAMDCGPTCPAMIAQFYGKNLNLNSLSNATQIGKEGVNI